MSLKIDIGSLGDSLESLGDRLRMAVLMEAQTASKEMESYAKANRKWTDRTGLAKGNLRSVVSQPKKNLIRITLSHGVDYGVFLELANEQKYAIIKPTLEKYEPELMESVRGLLDRVKS